MGSYTLAADDVLSDYNDDFTAKQDITVMMNPGTFSCSEAGQTFQVIINLEDECGNPTTVYSDITVMEGDALPAPWVNSNTHTSANGTANYSPWTPDGTFCLTATGQSTTTNDVFHFVYQQLCGNGTVIARLAEVENGGWAGVMMRESNAPNAKTVLFKTRLYNPNVLIGYRTTTGSSMRNMSQVAQLVRWMKIQRSGSTFKVFTSYNGTTWQQRFSKAIAMNNCIMAGIFTESVRASRTSKAWLDHVEVVDFLKTGEAFSDIESDNPVNDPIQIDLYPNPADDYVIVSIPGNENKVNFKITEIDGRLIEQSSFTGRDFMLDLSDLEPGLYVLRLEVKGEILTRKIVVM
jgi:hypothetical protein